MTEGSVLHSSRLPGAIGGVFDKAYVEAGDGHSFQAAQQIPKNGQGGELPGQRKDGGLILQEEKGDALRLRKTVPQLRGTQEAIEECMDLFGKSRRVRWLSDVPVRKRSIEPDHLCCSSPI